MLKLLSFLVFLCADPYMVAACAGKGKRSYRQEFGKAFLAGSFIAVSLAGCTLMSPMPGIRHLRGPVDYPPADVVVLPPISSARDQVDGNIPRKQKLCGQQLHAPINTRRREFQIETKLYFIKFISRKERVEEVKAVIRIALERVVELLARGGGGFDSVELVLRLDVKAFKKALNDLKEYGEGEILTVDFPELYDRDVRDFERLVKFIEREYIALVVENDLSVEAKIDLLRGEEQYWSCQGTDEWENVLIASLRKSVIRGFIQDLETGVDRIQHLMRDYDDEAALKLMESRNSNRYGILAETVRG
jgi:hypothetical protein